MKVKEESYLRSRKQTSALTNSVLSESLRCHYNFTVIQVTALLRETFKNSTDPNERLWHATVPSITQIWTRRPQWRRRHKNRKKSKYHRFPLASINSRIDEIDLWDTLKPIEGRPCSRSSTSPYETCSSRPFVTESDLSRNDDVQRKRELFGLPPNQRSQTFDRKTSVCETCSDSGLRRARGAQLVRPIRSQKRLGVRNSANGQNAVGTLSSLEANKSARLSVGRELSSDFSIPKRRVTFSNYVSENSATDTRSQISGTANDDDPREATWWEGSCGRLTDDEDNFSLRADLSCLFSSAIFDESKSSFFSLTASLNSEKSKKSAVRLNGECNECIFYVNPSYSNESSCDLVSLPTIHSTDDRPECDGIVTGNDRRFGKVLAKTNDSRAVISDEKTSRRVVPDAPIFREVNTDSAYRRSIECINIRLRDISSAVKEVSIGSGNDTVEQRDCDLSNNYVSTCTSDLVVLNVDRSLTPHAESLGNRINDARSDVNDALDSIQLPKQPSNCCNGGVLRERNELQAVRGDAKISKRVVSDAKISKRVVSDAKISKRVVSDAKISKRVVSDAKISKRVVSDAKIFREIECINIRLKDISSAVKEVLIGSGNETVDRRICNLSNNHVSADTSNLVLNVDRSFTPVAESLRNRVNDATFDFLQQPNNRIEAAFLLKELSRVGARTFGNRAADIAVGNIRRFRETDLVRDFRKADTVDLLQIETETCGEFETILIEVENLSGPFKENVVLKKSSSKRVRNCLEPCESLVVNLADIGKDSELVVSSASNFHNEYANCSGIGKCCLICGRKKIDNPRYLRPVCQVKGVTPTSRLENDPWIGVMNKVVKNDNCKELANRITKNLNTKEDRRSLEDSSKDSASSVPKNVTNEPSHLVRNESESVVGEVQEDCFSETITGAGNSSPSMATVESNVQQILSSRDQSTSCPSDPERRSSTSFGFATFRCPRTQSAKTYFMRESVRTVEGTANRLLCVISESDSLMAVPPFLPKKPPDWFGRHRMPMRKSSRR